MSPTPYEGPGRFHDLRATVAQMRRTRFALLLLLICGVLLPATAGAAMQADRNGDKVFDDLAADLGGSAPRDVIIALNEPATAARVRAIETSVGDLGDVI